MAHFEVTSRHVPGATEDNQCKSQNMQCPGQDLNTGPPECEAGGCPVDCDVR
jgi:hypothetical protein